MEKKKMNVLFDDVIDQLRNSGTDENLQLAITLSNIKTKISKNIIDVILFFRDNVLPLIEDKNDDNMLIIRKMISMIDAIDE